MLTLVKIFKSKINTAGISIKNIAIYQMTAATRLAIEPGNFFTNPIAKKVDI